MAVQKFYYGFGGNDANAGTLASPWATPMNATYGGPTTLAPGDYLIALPNPNYTTPYVADLASQSYTEQDGVNHIGPGGGLVVLQSDVSGTDTGSVYCPGMGSFTSGIKVVASIATPGFGIPVGWLSDGVTEVTPANTTPPTGFTISNCIFNGGTDSFYPYWRDTAMGAGPPPFSGIFLGCDFNSHWDTTNGTASLTVSGTNIAWPGLAVDFYDCSFSPTAPWGTGPNNQARGLLTAAGKYRAFNPTIAVVNNMAGTAVTYGVAAQFFGSIELYRGSVSTTASNVTTGKILDLIVSSATASIRVDGTTYNVGKTSGAILVATPGSVGSSTTVSSLFS